MVDKAVKLQGIPVQDGTFLDHAGKSSNRGAIPEGGVPDCDVRGVIRIYGALSFKVKYMVISPVLAPDHTGN